MEKQICKLSNNLRINFSFPEDFDKVDVGDIVIHKGWPHIVIDAGTQGKKIAAFREPFGWKVTK